MVNLTTKWKQPLFVDTDLIDPIQTPLGLMANAADAGIESAYRKGSSRVADSTERDIVFPLPAQGDRVFRLDLGYEEGWFDTYNATSNPGGRVVRGWQPSALIPAFATSYVEFLRTVTTDAGFSAINVNLATGTLSNARPGLYRVFGFVSMYAQPSAVGSIYTNAGNVQVPFRCDLDTRPGTYSAEQYYRHTGGDLAIAVGYSTSSGAATVTGTGGGQTKVAALYVGA